MPACVAVINAGSSSIKFALYAHGADEAASFRGQVEGIGTAPRMVVKDQSGQKVAEAEWSSTGFAPSAGDERYFRDRNGSPRRHEGRCDWPSGSSRRNRLRGRPYDLTML